MAQWTKSDAGVPSSLTSQGEAVSGGTQSGLAASLAAKLARLGVRGRSSLLPRKAKLHDAQELAHIDNTLIHTIEGEIIPRLLLAHQHMLREQFEAERTLGEFTSPPMESSESGHINWSDGAGLSVSHEDVVAFAELLIAYDADLAKRFIDAQVARGYAVSDLLLDLCAPVARELGDMWLRDDCSFCDVTIGLSSLEHVILHCSGPSTSLPNGPDRDRTVLLSPMPGNQHVFGLLIVKELFRRSGWIVRTPAKGDAESVLQAVRSTRFSVMGLSVSHAQDLQACQTLVKACREESLNPRLMVIVGGHGIQEANMSTRMLDADLIARDGREGLDQIERMISRISSQQPFN